MEKGNKEEAHLERSIQNLRMRSSYSSGFNITTPSFMTNNKKIGKAKEAPNSARKEKVNLKVLKPKVFLW